MKLHVKLFGFLWQQIPEYAPPTGMDVHLTGGSTVNDLLKRLDFHPSGNHVVIRDGRVLQAQEEFTKGGCNSVFPVVDGG